MKKTKITMDDYLKIKNNDISRMRDVATTTQTTNTMPQMSTNFYGADLYQQYLDSVSSTERAKSDNFSNKVNSMKYANDMLKATGYGSTGMAQSTNAGIMNNYLNAAASLNANQYNTNRQLQFQSSQNALTNATSALENGMEAQDILNTYGKYMNSQDMDTFNFYVNQANKLREEEFKNTYSIDDGKELTFDEIAQHIDIDPIIKSQGEQTNKLLRDKVIELANSGKYDGYATELHGIKLIIHNGKYYKITDEVYNQLKDQGKTIEKIL